MKRKTSATNLHVKRFKQVFTSVCLFCFGIAHTSFCSEGISSAFKKGNRKEDTASLPGKDFQSLLNVQEEDSIYMQPHPMAVSFIKNFTQKEAEEFDKMKVWGKTYFDLYDKILSKYGVPTELKYLSVIESHLRSKLVSKAGAVGPWQLMYEEAKRYGLKTGKYDERKDYYKSTVAAAKILKRLYDEFDNWLLVIAAYNAGEGRVRKAIKNSGSKDFWKLQTYLPLETRNHVKKYIATHYYFEKNGGITTFNPEETKTYLARLASKPQSSFIAANAQTKNTKSIASVNIQGKYNANIIMKELQINKEEFYRLNPDFNKALQQGKLYSLRLPSDKVKDFESKKQQILQQSIDALIGEPSLL